MYNKERTCQIDDYLINGAKPALSKFVVNGEVISGTFNCKHVK